MARILLRPRVGSTLDRCCGLAIAVPDVDEQACVMLGKRQPAGDTALGGWMSMTGTRRSTIVGTDGPRRDLSSLT
jgi:hypothetical protein